MKAVETSHDEGNFQSVAILTFKDYTENINQDTEALNSSSNTTQSDMRQRRESVSDQIVTMKLIMLI